MASELDESLITEQKLIALLVWCII